MDQNRPKPENYLVVAILSTILCCWPAGVVSIVYAAKVNGLDSNAVEEWEKSSDHLFLGTAYVESKGEKVVKEKIRIESINNTYYYIAEIPETSISVTFNITHIGESGFVCESEEINFPRKISYELNGFDDLSTRLEGLGKKLNFSFYQ